MCHHLKDTVGFINQQDVVGKEKATFDTILDKITRGRNSEYLRPRLA